MKKELLMKYAEQGVIKRLAEIQLEINALAREFPHLVQNQNGSVPAVTPIMMKPKKGGKNPELSKQRKAWWAALSPAERAARSAKMVAARRKNQKLKTKSAAK